MRAAASRAAVRLSRRRLVRCSISACLALLLATTAVAERSGVEAKPSHEPFPSELDGDLLVFDLWRLDAYRARPDGSDVRKVDLDLGGSNAVGVASGTRAAYGTAGGVVAGAYVAGLSSGGAWISGPALGAMAAASGAALVLPAIGITKAVQIAKRHHRSVRSVVQAQNCIAMSPAGDRILLCSDTAKSMSASNLRLLEVSGERGNRTSVRTRLRFGGLCPEFSPDARWAIFTAPPAKKAAAEIWRFDVQEGFGPKQLTDDGAPKAFPHYSPDGRSIAWQGLVLEGAGAGTWQAFVMSADGGAPRQVSGDSFAAVTPSWSPAGDALAYASLEDGSLMLAPLDGAAPLTLVLGGNMKLHPQLSRDGRYVMYLESSVEPANLQPAQEGEKRAKKDKPLIGSDFRLKVTRLGDGATWLINLEKPGGDDAMEKTNLFWFQWRRPAPPTRDG